MTAAIAAGTFTRDEGYAVAAQLRYREPNMIQDPTGTRDDLVALVTALQAEIAISDGGDWWGAGNPRLIGLDFQAGEGPEGPETYPFAAEALPALIDRLPVFVDWTAEAVSSAERGVIDAVSEFHRRDELYWLADARRRLAALTGLAARLGVEIPDAPQPAVTA
jgi:hypothetical protein